MFNCLQTIMATTCSASPPDNEKDGADSIDAESHKSTETVMLPKENTQLVADDTTPATAESSNAQINDNIDGGICTRAQARASTSSSGSASSSNQTTPEKQPKSKVKSVEKVESHTQQVPPMRGYKITDNERTRRYGIGANSLQMLKDKAYVKFPIEDLRLYLASDGFEVPDDDYLQTLPSQTLFVVAEPDKIITTDADFEYEQYRNSSPLIRVSDIVYQFMEKHPEQFRKMITVYEARKLRIPNSTTPTINTANNNNNAQAVQDKTVCSLRIEHTEWFDGQEERAQTKEEVMMRRAQDRMRGYYYKTKEELTQNKMYRQNMKARHAIDTLLEQFRYLLIGCDYFSMIFDRKYPKKHADVQERSKDDETDARLVRPNKRLRQIIKDYTARHQILDEWSVSLCNDLGNFYCQGNYSSSSSAANDNGNGNGCCSLQHIINPYASRENLILFQVWNLDHQIELSRTILPSLLQHVRELVEQPQAAKCALHNARAIGVSVLEYFLEIFSLKNLKLVHIVCHEKTQRANKSNGRLVCAQCHEYRILQELLAVRNKDEVDMEI